MIEATASNFSVLPDLMARAEAIVPSLVARGLETETSRRVPDANIDELKAAGLHRICQPARFGGHEATLNEACDVVAMLSRGCEFRNDGTGRSGSVTNISSQNTTRRQEPRRSVWIRMVRSIDSIARH